MSGKLIFGLMASVIMTCAWGASSTVTSRDYVDNALATKQVKIPSAGTAGARRHLAQLVNADYLRVGNIMQIRTAIK